MTDDLRVVLIDWIDSSVQNAQVGPEDYPKPATVVSVGLLVEEATHWVTIARDQMDGGEYRGLLCIPRECLLGMSTATRFERSQDEAERKLEVVFPASETGC